MFDISQRSQEKCEKPRFNSCDRVRSVTYCNLNNFRKGIPRTNGERKIGNHGQPVRSDINQILSSPFY